MWCLLRSFSLPLCVHVSTTSIHRYVYIHSYDTMEQYYVLPLFITLVFCAIKVIDSKYMSQEPDRPLKFVIRDALIVFAGSFLATFLYVNLQTYIHEFLNVVTDTKTVPVVGSTEIFMGDPGF